MAVYDEEKQTESDTPGIYDSDEQINKRETVAKKADQAETPENLKAAEADGTTGSRAGPAAQTEADKLSSLTDQVGHGFNPSDNSRIGRLLQSSLHPSKRRRNAMIGGGVGAAIVAGLISLFLALLPLKINHIVENLQKRFMSSTTSATQRWSDKLFSNYMKKYIMPNLGDNCVGGTVNKDCVKAFDIPPNSPAAKLYRGWKDARLENVLAEKYGISFERSGQTFKMKVSGADIDVSDLEKAGSTKDLSDVIGNRSDVRQAWRTALEDETRFTQVLYRFKVGKLLERKYGIKRCIFACKLQDSINDWNEAVAKNVKITAADAVFSERVLGARGVYLSTLFGCVTTGGCDQPTDTSPDGEQRDKFQVQMAEKFANFEAQFGTEAAEKLLANAQTIGEKGFSAYLVEQVAGALGGDVAGEAAGNAVPVVGWINSVASFLSKAKSAGPKIKKWGYITTAAGMVSTYMMYRTVADEMKSGHTNEKLLGSMVSSLGDTAGDQNHQGQPAELSPLYNNVMGSGPSVSAASLTNWLSPTAYAASDQAAAAPQYTCDDNKPPLVGKLVCPEENLHINDVATTLSSIFNLPVFSQLGSFADFWTTTIGKVLGLAGDAFKKFLELPPISFIYNPIASQFSHWAQPFITAITNQLIPNPFSDHMSGARKFNMITGGADVMGSDYGQYGVGGQALSDQQAADIWNQQDSQDRAQFAQLPLWQRLFDKNSDRSLVTQIAMFMPTDRQVMIQNGLASLITNPFSKLTTAFASLFSSPRVHAATATPDPFGITQYGYPFNDPAFSVDPDTLTDDYCARMNAHWADGTDDPNDPSIKFSGTLQTDAGTGMEVHTKADPCKLNSATVGGLGALYDNSLLGADQ